MDLTRETFSFKNDLFWESKNVLGSTNVGYEDLHFPTVDDFQLRNKVGKFSFAVSRTRNYWLRTWYISL